MKVLWTTISFLFILSILISSESDADWAFRFVVYSGNIYVISEEEINESHIEDEIGQVTFYSDVERTYGGNFSNTFPEGTRYFEITGEDVQEVIAIGVGDQQFVKAYQEGQYAGGKGAPIRNNEVPTSTSDELENSLTWVLMITLIVMIFVLTGYIKQKYGIQRNS